MRAELGSVYVSMSVCEFPQPQRLSVAPEALIDTMQAYPLRGHILSTLMTGAQTYQLQALGRYSFLKGPSTTEHPCFTVAYSNLHLLE